MKPENVVWDMGGVFRRYFTEVMVDHGVREGWPLERLPLGPTGVVDDPDYRLMTDGGLDEPQYLNRIVELLLAEGISFDPPKDLDWDNEQRPEVWRLIEDIAVSPIRQAILTNDASKWLGESWWMTWPSRHLFDVIVDVSTLGVRKPQPEPFLHVLHQLDSSPDACVFVDDMEVNCRAAEAVGMQSQWFNIVQPQASTTHLRERIGL